MVTATIERKVYDIDSLGFDARQVNEGDILEENFKRDGTNFHFEGLVISNNPLSTIKPTFNREGIVKNVYDIMKNGSIRLRNLFQAGIYEPENVEEYKTKLRDAGLL